MDELLRSQSGEGEVIEMKKKELLGQAIKEYQKERLSLDEQLDQYAPKKKC